MACRCAWPLDQQAERHSGGLVEGLCGGQVIADRAYDALQFHDVILDHGGKPVIPSLLLFND